MLTVVDRPLSLEPYLATYPNGYCGLLFFVTLGASKGFIGLRGSNHGVKESLDHSRAADFSKKL